MKTSTMDGTMPFGAIFIDSKLKVQLQHYGNGLEENPLSFWKRIFQFYGCRTENMNGIRSRFGCINTQISSIHCLS